MVNYVIPGAVGGTEHNDSFAPRERQGFDRSRVIVRAASPAAFNAQGLDHKELQRTESRFPSNSHILQTSLQDKPASAGQTRKSAFDNTLAPGESIKGNLFFGGAGMDGGYIPDMVRAFKRKGITLTPVDPKKWSAGTVMDATVGVDVFRAGPSPIQVLLDRFPQSGAQFNLIGYSYGSLAASQVAIHYGQAGTTIDHLVLIGSPIAANFLQQLRGTSAIKNVIVINLDQQGDPLHAGMGRGELILSAPQLGAQMVESSGHFYYAPNTEEGKKRRDSLADHLYGKGLR